jgi:hypothetical protein
MLRPVRRSTCGLLNLDSRSNRGVLQPPEDPPDRVWYAIAYCRWLNVWSSVFVSAIFEDAGESFEKGSRRIRGCWEVLRCWFTGLRKWKDPGRGRKRSMVGERGITFEVGKEIRALVVNYDHGGSLYSAELHYPILLSHISFFFVVISHPCSSSLLHVPRFYKLSSARKPQINTEAHDQTCRQLILTLFPFIYPLHLSYSFLPPQLSSTGQSAKKSGQVPPITFGIACQLHLVSPSICTISPDLTLIQTISCSLSSSLLTPSLSLSREIKKSPSQPKEKEASPRGDSSDTSRWTGM